MEGRPKMIDMSATLRRWRAAEAAHEDAYRRFQAAEAAARLHWRLVWAALAIVAAALLWGVAGCADSGACHPSIHVLRPDNNLPSYDCAPGAHIRIVPVGDGDKLRSMVLCECGAGAPGADMAMQARIWR